MLYLEQVKDWKCHCGNADCSEGLIMHGKCHMASTNKIKADTGLLCVACNECSKPIVHLAIVQGDPKTFTNVWAEVKNGKVFVKSEDLSETLQVFAIRSAEESVL